MGQGNRYTYYKCCCILPVDEHCIGSAETYHFISFITFDIIIIIIIIIINLCYHPLLEYFKFTLRVFSEAVMYKSSLNVSDVTESMIIGLPIETKTTDGGCQIFPLNFQLEFHYSYLRKIVLH